MRVSILGAGAIAYGMAAYLAHSGHQPVLWSPSGRRTTALAAGAPLVARGALEGEFKVDVAPSCAAAIAGADVVLVALPAYGHKTVLDAAAPHLRRGQPVIISSHLSFGALYLSHLLAARRVAAPISLWSTTLLTARQTSATGVTVSTMRDRVDVATVPTREGNAGLRLCQSLFGDHFVLRDGLLAIALSNLNPQNHLGIALLNLTRMERGESWNQSENVTGTVGRLIEALDAERLAIAQTFGCAVKTVREHFSQSFHVPIDSVTAMNQDMFRRGYSGLGPNTLQTRYILEDVPFGLVPTVWLGRLAQQPTPLHQAGVALFSAACGHDFARENNLLPALPLSATFNATDLMALARDGYPPG